MTTQAEKAEQFRALHSAPEAFVIPNPWDIGSARLLALAGFKALATSSAGYAFSRGLPDNAVGRAQMMVHLAEIAGATDLPVSADLENGFGDAPEDCAQTIRMAAQAGVVGGSIEDATGRADEPIYPFQAAVERVRAAVEAARALPFPFTLTARAENYLADRPDLDDTIRRLQAYEQAGADVLYAPGLRTREEIAAVVDALDRPVNVLMGLQGVLLGFEELRAMGVRRVSVGGSLARAALGAFLRAAHEIRDQGTFNYTKDAASGNELNQLFATAEQRWPTPR
ncbi:isocitrate lyase/phosphoenolpyruvate mutase family protein [bacterium M00.F.Ca.ET.228.01.1.1]|uniref:isocitrate lyase/PEP mutase family protein n=1 Tax=Paraburkholderia phenoliruptrix TaxID=252970 RepID=UPI001091F87A|nr:isocitrate lyase/phosphoenolpyruvate mutase family protein [Paraburkholderia phenoliruptrix]TGP39740.1 isocitrate lyase/phosphoenolpyruvate mutase family protein [bacterium M00.F.Ca.ET.228.01.1.1]TGR95581.1 isocitrate lyase/phosphoenolpyruvate mutase family protein [bacterium M00.F.Ca.ET.191.01.1.1]TGT96569.1 isocitrate lyase/phosphoenolpyruvate mutase family protein [bacterium M00.F.Ca.ET.155.01.1.1]MBW0450970.1 isocitrate lyase/phosphoenolpyruvate mutase family protein [Paraburkholderia ph